ncbi:MAG: hypothetical protein AB1566_06495 [Chloroflexota bacterium]
MDRVTGRKSTAPIWPLAEEFRAKHPGVKPGYFITAARYGAEPVYQSCTPHHDGFFSGFGVPQ